MAAIGAALVVSLAWTVLRAPQPVPAPFAPDRGTPELRLERSLDLERSEAAR